MFKKLLLASALATFPFLSAQAQVPLTPVTYGYSLSGVCAYLYSSNYGQYWSFRASSMGTGAVGYDAASFTSWNNMILAAQTIAQQLGPNAPGATLLVSTYGTNSLCGNTPAIVQLYR